MTDPLPPSQNNMMERGAAIVRSFSLTNVLILALIMVVSIPAYFAYRWMSDISFRREFMSGAVLIEKHAPCQVLEGRRYGAVSRNTMLLVYDFDQDMEKVIGLRSFRTLNENEILEACKKVLAMTDEIRRGKTP